MRICINQMNPNLLDLQTNMEFIIEEIEKSKEKDVDLNVFPELALTGYFVGPYYHKVALALDSKEIKKIVKSTKNTAAIVGFIEESPHMNFYNSALIAIDGELLYSYRKLNLPNYGVFEERKCFSSGSNIRVFIYKRLKISVFICNDLWHPSIPYLGVCQNADVFVSIFNSSDSSMAPEFSNIESWEIINKFYSRVFGIYNICANRVGRESSYTDGFFCQVEDEKIEGVNVFRGQEDKKNYEFWGGSEIINPFGQQIYKAPYYKEAKIIGEIDRNLLRRKKIMLPYLRNDDPYFTHRELERILYKK